MSTDSKIEALKKSLTKTQIIDQVMSKWGIYIALLLLIILMAAIAPNFLSIKNGLNIVNDGLAHKMYDTREVNTDIILSNLPSYLD